MILLKLLCILLVSGLVAVMSYDYDKHVLQMLNGTNEEIGKVACIFIVTFGTLAYILL